jgi:hypothetical protein
MTTVLLIALGVVVLACAAGVLLVRRALRTMGRRFGGWQWRLMEMRTRFQPPGPRRDAARLRCRLNAELAATRDMLQTAPQGLIFRADATAVLAELSTTAIEIDRELAAVQRFLDPGQQRAAVATVRPHVEQLIQTTYSARQTILRTAVEDRTRHLTELRAKVTAQADALEQYRKSGHELSL